ncbi:5355_t:CDS:2 [Entrophospora sp. SA101]|nr:5351_t:CDS:2 [Entrophospora sp. SA101]CAJ0767939.1 5355_t:CDS:2 [Entrophospora sp. SA101]
MSDPTIFSNFIPTSLNVIRCDNDNDNYKMCIVAMKSGEKICFQGSLLVATIYGDALIMGYRLKSAKSKFLENNFNNFEGEKEMDILFHPVFSPKTHSLLVIDIKASNGIKHCINEMLKKNNEHNILRNGYDTILVFRDIVSWCGIKHLGIVAPIYSDIFIPDDDKYKSNIEKQDFFQIPGFYPIFEMINEEGVTSFKILDSWKHAADEMETGLIKCPKVAYLETDIGQSEFTPEGILSLNIIESPILGVPLIINTHGWVKGMGLDICYEVIKFSKPTHIFQFHSVDQEIHNLPAFPTDLISSLKMTNESTALKIIKLEFFDNSTISNKRYTSSDYRTLNMVFYFHGNYNNGTQDDGNDEWWQFRKPLVRHLPWCLNWKRCLTKGVMLMSEEVPYSQLLYALNGSRSSKGVMVSFGVCGIPWNKLPYMSVEAGEGVGSTARNNRRYLKRRQYS